VQRFGVLERVLQLGVDDRVDVARLSVAGVANWLLSLGVGPAPRRVELPLAMDRWVRVPRTLARFDPELAWTLDYEDEAPEPEDADPPLDYSAGASRFDRRVELRRWRRATSTVGGSAVRIVARAATAAVAALALGYVVAVGAWLWSLRHQISGPDVSTGLLLVGRRCCWPGSPDWRAPYRE
jgi:hypothetical protein